MACELILGPSFRVLKNRLLNRLSRACANHPLGPKWLLVPTSTAANHLRLEIASMAEDNPLAGVHVVPMSLFVSRLLELIPAAARPRWEPAFEFLLYELVMRLPRESRLSRLQGVTGGYARLKSTFLDLAEGGFGTEQTDVIQEMVESGHLSQIERETLQLYLHWLQTLDAAELEWDPQLRRKLPPVIEEASERALNQVLGVEEGQQSLLMVYGFYEFTDINSGILAALARRIPTSLFFPNFRQGGQPHPAFAFTEEVLHDLRARMGTALANEQQELDDEEPLHFFLNSFPEGDPETKPGFISYQSASGIRSEVLSAGVQIRKWLDEGVKPHEILLVAPHIESYAGPAREIFSSFSIPLRILDLDPGLTPENRPYVCIRRIWEERAPVEWVLSYFRDSPELCSRREVSLSSLEKKLRRLPLLTSHSWRVLNQLILDKDVAIEPLHFTPAEATLIQDICQLWIPSEQRTFSGSSARDFLRKISEDWMPRQGTLYPLIDGLRLMERLRPDLKLPEKMLLDLFIRSTPRERSSDPMTLNGVLLAPMMRARGLTAKAVVLMGLSSDQIPYHLEEDPLLSDLTRFRLSRAASDLGHRLPVKARLSDEMALLFFLVNTSAEQIHWVLPETDDQGKSVAITPWVQRYLQHWNEGSKNRQAPPRIPRSPREQAQLLYDLSPRDGRALPPSFARTLGFSDFQLLEKNDPDHWQPPETDRRHFPPEWSGFIPAASLSQGFPLVRVSVTQLESLARCPYRFYAQVVEKLAPVEVLDFAEEPTALDWGRLVHELLENCFSDHLSEKRSLASTARELLKNRRAGLKEKLARLSPESSLLFRLFPPYLTGALQIRLLTIVEKYLQQLVQDGDDAYPLHLESKMVGEFPSIPTLQVVGKIDRIDQAGDTLRVIDYKSGGDPWKNDSRKSQRQELEVLLGYRMQPHLYPWLARETNIGGDAEFQFLFLGEDPPASRVIHTDVTAEELLKSLAGIFMEGYFFPTSSEAVRGYLDHDHVSPCAWCEFISVCRRFDRSAPYHGFNLLRQKMAGRFEATHKFLNTDNDEPAI